MLDCLSWVACKNAEASCLISYLNFVNFLRSYYGWLRHIKMVCSRSSCLTILLRLISPIKVEFYLHFSFITGLKLLFSGPFVHNSVKLSFMCFKPVMLYSKIPEFSLFKSDYSFKIDCFRSWSKTKEPLRFKLLLNSSSKGLLVETLCGVFVPKIGTIFLNKLGLLFSVTNREVGSRSKLFFS